MDVLKFPKLFKGTGVSAFDVEPSDAMRAEQIHRNEMQRILQRHGALSHFPTAPSMWAEPKESPKDETQDALLSRHGVAAVARWMGSEEWPIQRAERVLERLGATVSHNSLRNYLYRGKKFEEGLADLSVREIKQLAQLAKEIEDAAD